ncbi:hypothetical protein Xen7305DRAFT_00053100 [Xenococcus sp. PCC 7305]|uniref:hypothetical protein n=1 Tax=Xenococcus sp. PCC 7305 TaxID=102125 RepID=UPI0002AC6574|nr:hypothetical protein [Xenococcus sp. PCC 7305]ELS05563.1 hypothetical protein Xen7305DRAFT_00053100 [Xenococcus sp. PCC 7305]
MNTSVAIPEQSTLFNSVLDGYGRRLALVFGNEFQDGRCPFHQSQCNHCDIGAGEGVQFNYELNQQRLVFFQDYYGDVLPDIVHLVIYNSGSTLNKLEMSPETLFYIAKYAASLEKCKIVSWDSRECYIKHKNLDVIVNNLRQDQQIKIILGIESQDETIRMVNLKKLMSKEAIEKAFAIAGTYQTRIGIEFNIVFQPPEIVGQAAIEEAEKTVRYGLDLSQKYEVPIDFNFHPYYPSRKSQVMFPDHPRAQLEDSLQALLLMKQAIAEYDNAAKIFIGWQDEAHDREQDKRTSELQQYLDIFNRFNIEQNIAILQDVV